MAKKKWSPCAPPWSQERNLAAFPAPGTHLGPIQSPKMIQRGLKRVTGAPPCRHSKLSAYCGIFVQRVVLRGVLETRVSNHMGAGCHTQVSVPSLEHQNQFASSRNPLASILSPHLSTNSFMLCTLPNIGQCFIHRSTFLPCRTHWNRYSLLSSFRETSYMGNWASTGSRTGCMVSPPGVEMSKMSTMSTWWADNSKSENRNPTNTAGKSRSPGQANTCRIPEIWLSFSCLKFTCIEGRRLWRGGFRTWGLSTYNKPSFKMNPRSSQCSLEFENLQQLWRPHPEDSARVSSR